MRSGVDHERAAGGHEPDQQGSGHEGAGLKEARGAMSGEQHAGKLRAAAGAGLCPDGQVLGPPGHAAGRQPDPGWTNLVGPASTDLSTAAADPTRVEQTENCDETTRYARSADPLDSGRSDTDTPAAPYDAELHLARSDGLFTALGLDARRVVALGYSFGGAVARALHPPAPRSREGVAPLGPRHDVNARGTGRS